MKLVQLTDLPWDSLVVKFSDNRVGFSAGLHGASILVYVKDGFGKTGGHALAELERFGGQWIKYRYAASSVELERLLGAIDQWIHCQSLLIYMREASGNEGIGA